MNTQLIICCDWGTSCFRLYLANPDTYEVMAKVTTSMGIAMLHKKYTTHETKTGPREKYYLNYLGEQIENLTREYGKTLEGIPVITAGMASSSIGIRELQYAHLPFPVNGSDMITEWVEPSASCPHPVLLLSGVCSGIDVMRGEETQLAGIQYLTVPDNNKDCVYIFPGTHCKHIFVDQGKVSDFKTYLTGELFAILCQYSILKDVVINKGTAQLDDEEMGSFLKGINKSGKDGLLHSLFSVRTNYLLGHFSKELNYYFLSGLLIGEELRSLHTLDKPLFLSAGNSLLHLYKTALAALNLSGNSTILPPEITGRASLAGQIEIYKKTIQHREY